MIERFVRVCLDHGLPLTEGTLNRVICPKGHQVKSFGVFDRKQSFVVTVAHTTQEGDLAGWHGRKKQWNT